VGFCCNAVRFGIRPAHKPFSADLFANATFVQGGSRYGQISIKPDRSGFIPSYDTGTNIVTLYT